VSFRIVLQRPFKNWVYPQMLPVKIGDLAGLRAQNRPDMVRDLCVLEIEEAL
jgi:hypothetical protein